VIATATRLTYRYPSAGRDAVRDASFNIVAGEVVVLAGPSGSGKTTLLRALAGLVPHYHGGRFGGTVTVAGSVGIAFQDPEAQGVYRDVVRDVAFGLECRGVAPGELRARALAALALVGAGHLAGRTLDALSGGELQLAALAGVLAPEPALLLLDEPTAQLDDATASTLLGHLRTIADGGTAIVIAEHRLDRVAGIADRTVWLGEPDAVEAHPAAARDRGGELLAGRALVADRGERRVLDGLDVALHAGEVVALQGANGAGKSTLLRVLAGLDRPCSGTVTLLGEDVTDLPAEQRHPRLALVPQDPGRHLLCERVDEEVAFAGPSHAAVADALAALGIGGLAARHPRDLSAGERERVALAVALAVDPAVLLLDEPTRGMDGGSRRRLAALLRERTTPGRAVLVATHDAGFAALAADRVVAL
jgi:energy-coupling factor transport system ATP-binding protein